MTDTIKFNYHSSSAAGAELQELIVITNRCGLLLLHLLRTPDMVADQGLGVHGSELDLDVWRSGPEA